jgi:uncharacterized membrane protein (UPF0136 family)
MLDLDDNSHAPRLPRKRHRVLLLAIAGMLVVQPLAHGILGGLIAYDILLTLVLLGAFAVVFARGRERFVSLALTLAAIISSWATYGITDNYQFACATVHYGATIAFTGFAVSVILRGVFSHKVIETDDVLGVVCGYLLAGVAWGNCYLLAELIAPKSFSVNHEIAWQLKDAHSRGFLFNYYSFCTLTTVGYGDITPVAPVVASLSWLESVFGHFYIAIVVAQLVGLKLAQASKKETSDSGQTAVSPRLALRLKPQHRGFHQPHHKTT